MARRSGFSPFKVKNDALRRVNMRSKTSVNAETKSAIARKGGGGRFMFTPNLARKRRHLAYFAIGLNDSGRVGELEKFLGKNGGKKKGKREDDDEDEDDAGDDWDVKDLFANAKKS